MTVIAWLTAGLRVLILLLIFVFFRPFLVISFDPVLAATRVGFYNYLLLILLASLFNLQRGLVWDLASWRRTV